MARPVYSQLLWEESIFGPGAGHSVTVPAGYVWVVRDIVMWNDYDWGYGLNGLVMLDSAGGPLMCISRPFAYGQQLYHQEMRQVLETGDQIFASTGDSDWNFRVSGYALTTP